MSEVDPAATLLQLSLVGPSAWQIASPFSAGSNMICDTGSATSIAAPTI
jgi:hypothetical protein